MRVCVVGAGGREHAIAHVLARGGAEVVATPGNPGMAAEPHVAVTPAPPEEIDADLYVIGPEAPLVGGLADRLRARGCLVFGPGADGARLEGSKAWMKEVLVAAGVPTARHAVFSGEASLVPAREFLRSLPGPYVVKTDGLAAGKGVFVTDDVGAAGEDLRAKLEGRAFGDAGRTVVIEEGLTGPELSVVAVCDGRRAVCLAPAQDHKRVGDGDTGPNTGGMGAYSPVPVAIASPSVVEEVMERAIVPTLGALRGRGIDYRGVLYCGLMLTPEGPKVLEYNVRFPDPEAQVILPRLDEDEDLAALLAAAAAGQLPAEPDPPRISPDACVTVVMACAGYPTAPRPGDIIYGVEEATKSPDLTVFHAGTSRDAGGALVTSGGRVLDVTGRGPTVAAAREAAYRGVGLISWPGAHWRSDIAATAATATTATSATTAATTATAATGATGATTAAATAAAESPL